MAKFEGVQFVSQIAYLPADSREGIAELTEGMIIVDSPVLESPEATAFSENVKSNYGEVSALDGYYTLALSDALNNLVHAANQTSDSSIAMHEYLVNSPLVGWLAYGSSFEGQSFLPGIEAAVFKILDGEAVNQK